MCTKKPVLKNLLLIQRLSSLPSLLSCNWVHLLISKLAELSIGPFMKNQGYINGGLITVFNYHHRWTKVTRC